MNAWLLAMGTLTSIRVAAPARVDRQVAGRAMVLAPLVGALLALVTAGPLWLLLDHAWGTGPLVSAGLVLGALALLTRGMHLDGLADVADGLGSARTGEAGLAIMKRSDIGPFGVVTLLLVLLVQAASLAEAAVLGWAPAVLALALVVSRGVLPVLCTRWFPAARAEGLGATVAASVGTAGLVVAIGLTALASASLVGLFAFDQAIKAGHVVRLASGSVAALAVGVLVALRARTRFGGVTGDVYGAGVEATFTASLVFSLLAL